MEIQYRLGNSKHPYSHWTAHVLEWLHCPSCKMLLAAYSKQHRGLPDRPVGSASCPVRFAELPAATASLLATGKVANAPLGTHGSEHSITASMGPEQLVPVPWAGLNRQSPWKGNPTAWKLAPVSEQCLQILVICHTKQFTSICYNHVRWSNFAEPFCWIPIFR